MKKSLIGFLVFTAIWMPLWILGCFIFDGLLHLGGAWLMGGGAITVKLADAAGEAALSTISEKSR